MFLKTYDELLRYEKRVVNFAVPGLLYFCFLILHTHPKPDLS